MDGPQPLGGKIRRIAAMKYSQFAARSAWTALAAALALGAMPASARPDGDGDEGNGRGQRAEAAQPSQMAQGRQQSFERAQQRTEVREQRSEARQQVQQAPAREAQALPTRAEQWQGRQQQADQQRSQWQGRQQQADQQRSQWQARQQADQQARTQQWQRQDQANRSTTYRSNDRNRDGTRYQNDQYSYRDGYRSGAGSRQWDRSWRNNNRYDWQRYRSSNRTVFHIGTYYSPYRNYSYRRLGVGFYLDQLFYGQNYWINDPWQYRLPDVYGPYRWVRYYDDALLVDLYTGEVVDVIYDFFW
jgi:hypothetical protein